MTDNDTPITSFADELDTLVERWQQKSLDDRPTNAEVVGALYFAAHNIMANAREEHQENHE